MLYYEDIEIGTVQSFGAYRVTREEVIEFASKYDPQPFHLDDEAAAKTHFGKLSASGWHTTAKGTPEAARGSTSRRGPVEAEAMLR